MLIRPIRRQRLGKERAPLEPEEERPPIGDGTTKSDSTPRRNDQLEVSCEDGSATHASMHQRKTWRKENLKA